MKNKKASIGKIVSFPFVLIIVVVIMTAFMFAAITYSSFKEPSYQKEALSSMPEKSILLKKVYLPLENKETLVLDVIILRIEDEITLDVLSKSLSDLAKKENYCYFLNYQKDGIVQSNTLRNEQSIPKRRENSLFIQDKLTKNEFLLDDKKITIESYFGACP
ncbi:MAG: hypothetical protein AABY05_01010 [Nanoarchaeota archaeon]